MRQTNQCDRCSLIITTYNRPDTLGLVLKSALCQSRLPDEIIVADDGSGEETETVVEKFKKMSSVPVFHSWQEDRGFRAAASRNRAIALSRYDYIILVDGDIFLHKEFIRDHVGLGKKRQFIQGSRVLLTPESSRERIRQGAISVDFFDKGLKNRISSIHSVILAKIFSRQKNFLEGIKTCNMSFFREDCIEVNGFNENFTGWGREDSEFAARLMNNQVQRLTVKCLAIGYHLWHMEISRASLSKNDAILHNTVVNRIKWCDNGIDKYLSGD